MKKKYWRKCLNYCYIPHTNHSEVFFIEIPFLIVDVPEKPVGPIKIFDITKDSVTLTWKPPGNDGGAPITGYNIEYRNVNKPTWDRAGSVDSTTLSWKQTNLLEDSEYVFRVTAVNRKGESAPLESQGTVKLKKSALGLLILCCFMVL